MITPQGDAILRRGLVGVIAILFIMSLPSWALGILLLAGVAAWYGLNKLRKKEGRNDETPAPGGRRRDTR